MHTTDGERAPQCLGWLFMCRKLRSFFVAGRGYCTASKTARGEGGEKTKTQAERNPNKELRRKLARERLGRKTIEGCRGREAQPSLPSSRNIYTESYFLFCSVLFPGLRVSAHWADKVAHHALLFHCCNLRQPDHSWLKTKHEFIYLHFACQAV